MFGNLFAHHHHRCDDPWTEAPPWAVELREMLRLIINDNRELKDIIMAITDDLTALEASIKANTDAEDSAEAAFTKIAALIADLKNTQTDPQTAARIQAASAALTARAAQLAAAVVAATPAA